MNIYFSFFYKFRINLIKRYRDLKYLDFRFRIF